MKTRKPNIMIKGNVQYPLKIGQRAVIFPRNGDTRFTALVKAINQVADGFIVFETENVVYSVNSTDEPTPAAGAALAA